MYWCLALLLDCGFPQGKSLCFLGPCVLFPYDDDIATTQYVLVEASYEDMSEWLSSARAALNEIHLFPYQKKEKYINLELF